jgi:hypothetical protein
MRVTAVAPVPRAASIACKTARSQIRGSLGYSPIETASRACWHRAQVGHERFTRSDLAGWTDPRAGQDLTNPPAAEARRGLHDDGSVEACTAEAGSLQDALGVVRCGFGQVGGSDRLPPHAAKLTTSSPESAAAARTGALPRHWPTLVGFDGLCQLHHGRKQKLDGRRWDVRWIAKVQDAADPV